MMASEESPVTKRTSLGRRRFLAADAPVLTGVVLFYCTACNPFLLVEIDALRQARNVVDALPTTVVLGALVVPHSDATLREDGVDAARHLSFSDRVTLASMTIAAAGDDSWICVEPCSDGCLAGCTLPVGPIIQVYAKCRLGGPVVEPRMLEVVIEDPVHEEGFYHYSHIRAGTPRVGVNVPPASAGGTFCASTDPQEQGFAVTAAMASHAVAAMALHGSDGASSAQGRISPRGVVGSTAGRAACGGRAFMMHKAALAGAAVADGAAISSAVAHGGASVAAAVPPVATSTACSPRSLPSAGGLRRNGVTSDGVTGAKPLTSLGSCVESIVVDLPQLSVLNNLVSSAVKTPADIQSFQVLKRLCCAEVASKIKSLADRRSKSKASIKKAL
eukprot:TRINITY_DN45281_c0_g1_i1.p1 TRINITY_DN45281_c0_g1~~TRINITY_DN45281_c0_g1_i1.p1  ORF type:complete len:433 (+),score=83.18 TRINITY_DN45281_c0_g1_i1:133-1299(+)